MTLGAYVWRLYLLRVRRFDSDEFEHLHGAWLISQGMLPYRDFFEHHTPWLHYFLAPSFAFFNVETNVEAAHGFLFFARMCMWLFAGAILALTLRLGRLWRDVRVGCVAALFLGNTLMFLEKTLEVRPDLLSVMFWLACLALVTNGIRDEQPDKNTHWRFAWSGAFLGAAVMCTQKMLFAFPGFSLAMLWYLFDPRSRGRYGQRLWNVVYLVIGFCVPILLTLGYFALRGGLDEFIEYNFLLNARWKLRFSPADYLVQLVKQNPILVALALVGFFRAFFGMFGRQRFRRGEFVFALNALGLFLGLFIVPVPYRQYYLMFLPLGATFAAGLVVDVIDGLSAALRGHRPKNALAHLYLFAGSGAFILLLALALKEAHPRVLNDLFYPEMWGVALLLTVILLFFRRKNVAIALLLIALSVYPFKQMRDAANRTNAVVLNEIRYVLENTSPSETCMDGWTGRGVFRPHAWFYWFLHPEVRAMLSDGTKDELFAGLVSGSVAPKLLFLDGNLRELSEDTTRFFEEHYEPAEMGDIWRRK
ncbi:MAG: ArnT family glycosyltransferase [Thermoanaerobaculia bacterium]